MDSEPWREFRAGTRDVQICKNFFRFSEKFYPNSESFDLNFLFWYFLKFFVVGWKADGYRVAEA